jgi:quercetin dioxygenase-like cupin family protein
MHLLLDEVIYVIHGSIRVRLEDRVERADASACVFIPRGTPHTWAVTGSETARMLIVIAPAGLEQFFDSTASAGGAEAEDAFSRFGGDDLTVLGPSLAVTHPE